ncbi:hypothetical protein ES708_07643 [subsurface metagenome]
METLATTLTRREATCFHTFLIIQFYNPRNNLVPY